MIKDKDVFVFEMTKNKNDSFNISLSENNVVNLMDIRKKKLREFAAKHVQVFEYFDENSRKA
ncbi:hypothetical protein [Acetobacter estunensis]|uniref:hypothetical protein n=1 Tax=Acetobacter estunensis TaxID=104097 RepID=UPI001C2CD188|nr:hypothetical protein [Acetobacter estunensis]MBV1837283.1 hypothetical protein [Acetobacter estunensis]